MSEIRWEDPPDVLDGRGGHVRRFVAELQKHPGKWALYISHAGDEWVNRGMEHSIRERGCETRHSFIGRPKDQGKTKVRLWARWPDDVA